MDHFWKLGKHITCCTEGGDVWTAKYKRNIKEMRLSRIILSFLCSSLSFSFSSKTNVLSIRPLESSIDQEVNQHVRVEREREKKGSKEFDREKNRGRPRVRCSDYFSLSLPLWTLSK